jgi:hypothetical protein
MQLLCVSTATCVCERDTGGHGGTPSREPLTPSMGAMSRSYRARSGGLASELCLLGREGVPSFMGDTGLLTRLVMLWQLLGRGDRED